MFILRRITSESLQINECLGNDYKLIHQDLNPKEYKEALKTFLVDKDLDIYGFVIKSESKAVIPLYKKSTYFVMISNGQTFANISYR
jgi:hypothetical protein